MKKIFFLFSLLLIIACDDDVVQVTPPIVENPTFLKGVDLSSLPEIEAEQLVFKNTDGVPEDMMTTLKAHGCNAVRIRLWKDPTNEHSGLAEVKALAQRVKSHGMKVWLTVHYSDTWADPAYQTTPAAWTNLSFVQLKDSVYRYTKTVMSEIQPDYIQIGNEINGGFLWPKGNINNASQFLALLSAGTQAVRDNNTNTKIILHFAGMSGSAWFFDQLTSIDYDIIGLSYYPVWHGKDINVVETTLTDLAAAHNKEVLIAETAYPFTLEWNDWTNNTLGLDSQLILPDFPATPTGQHDFLAKLLAISKGIDKSVGVCYWGAELVAFKGPQSTTGSSSENQALYDFTNKALPAIKAFE